MLKGLHGKITWLSNADKEIQILDSGFRTLVETSEVTFMMSYLRAGWAADGILWAEVAFQIPTPLSPPTPSLLTIGWLFRSKSYRPTTFTYLVPPNYWELSLVPYFSSNASNPSSPLITSRQWEEATHCCRHCWRFRSEHSTWQHQ